MRSGINFACSPGLKTSHPERITFKNGITDRELIIQDNWCEGERG